MPVKDPKKAEKAREVVDILEEISLLLVGKYELHRHPVLMMVKNTHLNRAQLSMCISLIENGVNPEALAVCM